MKEKTSSHRLKLHASLCKICNHPDRKEIELDYVHCIPWTEIKRRYEIPFDYQINGHARALKLDEKRDRKNWYWRIMERFDFKKISASEAIEAAKQLDRLEHKLVDNPVPSQVQVVYQFPAMTSQKELAAPPKSVGEILADRNRLPTTTDSTQIPPQP